MSQTEQSDESGLVGCRAQLASGDVGVIEKTDRNKTSLQVKVVTDDGFVYCPRTAVIVLDDPFRGLGPQP